MCGPYRLATVRPQHQVRGEHGCSAARSPKLSADSNAQTIRCSRAGGGYSQFAIATEAGLITEADR